MVAWHVDHRWPKFWSEPWLMLIPPNKNEQIQANSSLQAADQCEVGARVKKFSGFKFYWKDMVFCFQMSFCFPNPMSKRSLRRTKVMKKNNSISLSLIQQQWREMCNQGFTPNHLPITYQRSDCMDTIRMHHCDHWRILLILSLCLTNKRKESPKSL